MKPWSAAQRMAGLVLAALVIAACGPEATPSPRPTPTPRPTLTPTASPAAATTRPSPTRAAGSPAATLAPVVTAGPTGQTYTVQKGDSPYSIAAKFGVTLNAFLAANPEITDPTKLQIGQVVKIPPK